MRALIDLDESDLHALNDLARAHHRSRAALVDEAIADFPARHRQPKAADAFGLWGAGGEDGLAHQQRIHAEW